MTAQETRIGGRYLADERGARKKREHDGDSWREAFDRLRKQMPRFTLRDCARMDERTRALLA